MKAISLVLALFVGFFASFLEAPPRLARHAASAATVQFENLWRIFQRAVLRGAYECQLAIDRTFGVRTPFALGVGDLVDREAVGKVQDLSQEFVNAESRKYPFTSSVRKGEPPVNAQLEYPVEKYDTPNTNAAVDEADPVTYQNPSDGDAMLYARVHTWERAVRIGGHSITFTHQAGITPRNIVAKKIAKKLVELKGDCELTFLGDQESQVDTGLVGNKTRGLGKWISSSAQSHYAVDANYLTPSASIDASTATDAYTDAIVLNVLKSSYGVHGDPEAGMTIWAGATWKQTLGRFTFYSRNVSNYTAVRQFNQSGTDKIVLGKVDMLETDFGNPVVRLSRFINASGDHTSAASKLLALGVIDDLVETRWAKQPYAEKLAKTGRNEKFLVTATAALCVLNPKPLFAWRPGS